MYERFKRAEEELLWWFIERDAALGISGTGFEGGGRVVWDDKRCAKEHLRRLSKGHLAGRDLIMLDKRVTATLAEVPESFGVFRLAFSKPPGRNPYPGRLHEAFRRANRNWSLIGVALQMPEASEFAEKLSKKKKGDPLDVFSAIAEDQNYNPAQLELKFRPLRLKADSVMNDALEKYDELRVQALMRAREVRAEELRRLRTAS